MCMCANPTVNGEPGYCSTYGAPVGVYKPNPPELRDGDELIFDEPGRCGGVDAHSYHHRLVKGYGDNYTILTRHGGGDRAFPVRWPESVIQSMRRMCSADRYWLLHGVAYSAEGGERSARNAESRRWHQAAVQNRIKVNRRKKIPTVEILPAQ